MYTGKGLESCVSDVGLCTRVVLDLLEGYWKALIILDYSCIWTFLH